MHIREDGDAFVVSIVGHDFRERACGIILEWGVLWMYKVVGSVLWRLVVEDMVRQGVGEMFCPALLSSLSPCVSRDVDGSHPVEGVIMTLCEAAIVLIETIS